MLKANRFLQYYFNFKPKIFLKFRSFNLNIYAFLATILLPLFVLPNAIYGYDKTHAYITMEAFNTWPRDCSNSAYQEFCAHRFPDPESNKYQYQQLINHCDIKICVPSQTYNSTCAYIIEGCIGDEYSGRTILEGDVEEDYGKRADKNILPFIDIELDNLKEWVDHFWDPMINAKINKSDRIFKIIPDTFVDYSLTAFEKGAFMFTLSYFYYKGIMSPPSGLNGKELGYYYLGRTAHLLQDMAVPSHANQDVHALQGFYIKSSDVYIFGKYGDNYERWTALNTYTGTSLHFDPPDPLVCCP